MLGRLSGRVLSLIFSRVRQSSRFCDLYKVLPRAVRRGIQRAMNASDNLSEGRVAYVLARVNSGLASEWSQIAQLASSLERMLKDARALGERHIRADRRSEWDAAWQQVQTIFHHIRSLDAEAQKRFTADEPSSDPLEPWSDVMEHEKQFVERLEAVGKIAEESIPASERSSWDDLCKGIEARIATLNAHAFAVCFQLEMRQEYGTQKANALAKKMAGLFPKDTSIANADKHAAEYQQAVREFEKEKETFSGAWDMLKAFMMVQPKPPAERVRDKYPQRLQRPPLQRG